MNGAELAERFGLNERTVRTWRKCETLEDARMGPKEVCSSSGLPPEEEAMCVAFRRPTLLPLDDCLYALQAIPHLSRFSRSALHRLFPR